MTRVFILFSIIMLLPGILLAQNEAILGKWKTAEGDGIFTFFLQDNTVAAKITWGTEVCDENGEFVLDKLNPDPHLRDRKIQGMVFIWGLKAAGDGKWEDGKLYNYQTGRTYSCFIRVEGNIMYVSGYIGFKWLKRTIKWYRIEK